MINLISLEKFINNIIKDETVDIDTQESFNETVQDFLNCKNRDYHTIKILRRVTPLLGALSLIGVMVFVGSISNIDAEILASQTIQTFLPGLSCGIAIVSGIFSGISYSSAKNIRSKIANDDVRKDKFIKDYHDKLEKKRSIDMKLSRLKEYVSSDFLYDHPIVSQALKSIMIDSNDKALCDKVYDAMTSNAISLDSVVYSLGINTFGLLDGYLVEQRRYASGTDSLSKNNLEMINKLLQRINAEAQSAMRGVNNQPDMTNLNQEPQYVQPVIS